MGDPVGVYMVDDESLDLTLLSRLIPWTELDLTLIGTASNARTAMEYLSNDTQVELLILDIEMPGYNGLAFHEKILSLRPDIRTIYISGHDEFRYAQRALELGAIGYILKPINHDELQRTLKRAHETITLLRGQRPTQSNSLVERMMQIATSRLGDGIDLRQMARELFYSPNYLSAAFKAETGINFSTYLNRIRLERACELLDNTRLTVGEISQMLGYTSSAHFISFFREHKGLTPGAFRRNGKNKHKNR